MTYDGSDTMSQGQDHNSSPNARRTYAGFSGRYV